MQPSDISGHLFFDDCCELRLSESDVMQFSLDRAEILIELRPGQDAFGVFYAARGREWDIWSHPGDEDRAGGAAEAMQDPVAAARRLLGRRWRADFDFDPSEDD